MKKLISVLIFVLIILPSQFKANGYINNDNSFIQIVAHQTQKFSLLFYNLGVTEINITNDKFYYSTHKDFIFLGNF